MKLNQATAAAFLFATLASSSLATSSHEELKEMIAPLLASKPDHYLRSHRMLQSSYDFPTTSSGSGSNCSPGSTCWVATKTAPHAYRHRKALLGLLGLIPAACCAAARRKTEEEEEEEATAEEPAAEDAAVPEA
jgi:hypothetical protein